jgi:hypothetical protein
MLFILKLVVHSPVLRGVNGAFKLLPFFIVDIDGNHLCITKFKWSIWNLTSN